MYPFVEELNQKY